MKLQSTLKMLLWLLTLLPLPWPVFLSLKCVMAPALYIVWTNYLFANFCFFLDVNVLSRFTNFFATIHLAGIGRLGTQEQGKWKDACLWA